MRPEDITQKWLDGKCYRKEDCLLWKGSVDSTGAPRHRFRDVDLDMTLSVRRHVLVALTNRRPLRSGEVVRVTCGHANCLNPEHMEVTTRRTVLMRNDSGASHQVRLLKLTNIVRATRAKLTLDQVRYVRSSDKPLTHLAKELGVSYQQLSKVRRGEVWADSRNPFAGLGC